MHLIVCLDGYEKWHRLPAEASQEIAAIWEQLPVNALRELVVTLPACGKNADAETLIDRFGLASCERLPAECAKAIIPSLLACGKFTDAEALIDRFGDAICPTEQELSGVMKSAKTASLIALTTWKRLSVENAKMILPILLSRWHINDAEALIERLGLASCERLPAECAKAIMHILLVRGKLADAEALIDRYGDAVCLTVQELSTVIRCANTANLITLATWKLLSVENAKMIIRILLTRGKHEDADVLIARFGDAVCPTAQELNGVITNANATNLIALTTWKRLPAEIVKAIVLSLLACGKYTDAEALIGRFGDVVCPTVQELSGVIKSPNTNALIKLAGWNRLPVESAKELASILLARGRFADAQVLIEHFGDVVSPSVQELNSAIRILNKENLVNLASWQRLPAESAKHVVSALLACGQVESIMRLIERFGDSVNPTVQELSGSMKNVKTANLMPLITWKRLPAELAKEIVTVLLERGEHADAEVLIKRFGGTI
jgi:hypothetical protein